MQKNFVWPLILVVAALLIASASLLFPPPPAQPRQTAISDPETEAGSRKIDSAMQYFNEPASHTTDVLPSAAPEPGEPALSEEAPPWQITIDRLLESEEDNDKVAAALCRLIPSLPPEGAAEATQHMVNLLDDDNYDLATQLLLNPALSPDQRDIIFSDVVDRPDSVKLPTLVALLGVAGHPLRAEARQNLTAVIGNDLGEDAAAWNTAIQKWLAEQAAEEEEAAQFSRESSGETGE